MRVVRVGVAVVALGAAAVGCGDDGGGSAIGACVDGTRRCASNGFVTCVDGAFAPATPCGEGESCSGGACALAEDCADECAVSGASECSSGDLVVCGESDGDACLDHGAPRACPGGQVCSAGACRSTCLDECAAGAGECVSGGAFRRCGAYDADPCLDWSTPVACATGDACEGGACVCVDTCTLGAVECFGASAVRTCVTDDDDDPCTEWSSPERCTDGQGCRDGACVGE